MTDPKKSHVASSMKYNAANTKQIKLNLNLKTDVDIIQYLEGCGNIQGTIKTLIREHIKRRS